MTNSENRLVSRDDFAQIVTDRIHQTSATAAVSYDREHFCLRGDEDENIHLHEPHKVYCATDDKSREKLLSTIARRWLRLDYSLPEEFADAAHDLMPYVHARAFFEVHAGRWPYQVLGEHFGVALAYERLGFRQLVSQEDLDAWDVSLDDALEVAKGTLGKLPADVARPKSGEGLCCLVTGDDRDSSRLLLPDIQQWNLTGDTIVMVPNRDALLIAGSEDEKGLAQMIEAAMQAPKLPRPISGIALRLAGETWVPWLPAGSHSLYQGFRQLQLQSLEAEYAAQEELLDERHEKSGQNIYVAPFWCLRRPDGTLVSATGWPGGAESMLPKADVIMFMRDGTDSAIVTWQGAASVVGNLMEPLDMYPARYRVRTFPSEVQLAWMASEHAASIDCRRTSRTDRTRRAHLHGADIPCSQVPQLSVARTDWLGTDLKENFMQFGDFQFDNMATVYFFLWVTEAKCNPDLGDTIARARDPALRNDREPLEGWITPAYLLAWDLLTWLLEKVTDWCETHLPDGHPLGWEHLVSNRDAIQGDPDHNLLFASLMGTAASMINFDQVAEALLIKVGERQVMHVPFSELGISQPIEGGAKLNLPGRPSHKQPRDETGKLTTKNFVSGMVHDLYHKRSAGES